MIVRGQTAKVMFTGIIERTLPILRADDHVAGRTLSLPRAWDDACEGESIAINGACLTISRIDGEDPGSSRLAPFLRAAGFQPGSRGFLKRASQA